MNRDTKIKIISTGIFLLLLLVMAYLVYFSNINGRVEVIGTVTVTGHNLLTENDYLNFTRLNISEEEKPDLKGLNTAIIRDRFQKHPYVLKASVSLAGGNKAKVLLTEKKMYGVIIRGPEPLFISEDFEVLPVFPNTRIIDLPVLTGIRESTRLKPLSKVKSDDMIQAFRIIDAIELTNETMMKNLSEINLRNGGDVLLTFSGMNAPVIFGRGNEALKIVYLETLLTGFRNEKNFPAESDYIDLRFNNNIYIGNIKKTDS
jgi:cell division septal protein FtsQ